MTDQGNRLFLAGDIGGTKTNLGLFEPGKTRPALRVFESFSSRDARNLEAIILRFMIKHPVSIDAACFGVAGPVINGKCRTTNLPWTVSEKSIKKRFGWSRVKLINDLTAAATTVPLLTGRDLFPLNRAKPRKGGNIGLLAPGTGFGQALLIYQDGRYLSVPSEGGHADFAPGNEREIELWRYLRRRYGHVSIERVLSGPGLVNIYRWLRDSGRYKEPIWLSKKMKTADPARTVSEAALEKSQPLCLRSLDMFTSILGSVAGNLALTGITTGGVYLGGGIPPKILPRLKEGRFLEAFIEKGRFRNLLERISVRVIRNERAALLGAAQTALSTTTEDPAGKDPSPRSSRIQESDG
jgi:glucokinase